MQMDANLIIEKAIAMSQQSQSAESQQATVQGELSQDTMVDSIAGLTRNTTKQVSMKKSVISLVWFEKSHCTRCG